MNWEIFFWLGAMILFLYLEANTVTLVSVWFAGGAVAGLITALFDGPFWLQAVLFMAVSVVLLAALRPLFKKYIKPKVVPTNVDAIIGSTGYVTEDIDNLRAVGHVKLGAVEWSARSTSGDAIAAGILVKVDRIEGVKAFVSVANENKQEENL